MYYTGIIISVLAGINVVILLFTSGTTMEFVGAFYMAIIASLITTMLHPTATEQKKDNIFGWLILVMVSLIILLFITA